jgi:large subunit ribosomal protein L28
VLKYFRIVTKALRRCLNMARCAICEKEKVFSLQVSHSHRKSARTWKPNIRSVRTVINGTPMKIQVCSRCLRSGLVERAM